MKKSILIIICSFFIFKTILAIPGEITHDPITYTGILKQIATTKKLIEEGQKQLAEMKDLTEGIGVLRENISTAYNNTFAIIGETKSLFDTFTDTKYHQRALEKTLFLFNCLGNDLDQYSKIDTLFTARYVTSTPTDHFANFGTDPNIKYNFGKPLPVQMAKRSCGYTKTFQDKIKKRQATHKKAFSVLQQADPSKKELLLKTIELKKYNHKQDKIKELINDSGTGNNVVTLTAKNKVILGLMYESLQEIKNIIVAVAQVYLDQIAIDDYQLEISDEQQDSIDKRSDKELLEGIHTEHYFKTKWRKFENWNTNYDEKNKKQQ